jgi:hypothetical protein
MATISEQALLSGTALAVFRLNGQFLGLADEVGHDELARTLESLTRLSAALDTLTQSDPV